MSSEKISFTNLKTEIVDNSFCVGCGTCEAVCPVNVIKLENLEPILVGKCIECGICYGNCPRTDFNKEEMDQTIHGRERKDTENLTGIYTEVYAAKAVPNDIMARAQDGGVVTALLTQFLAGQK